MKNVCLFSVFEPMKSFNEDLFSFIVLHNSGRDFHFKSFLYFTKAPHGKCS